MSVPVNERSHGKLEACVKAHALCCYTLRITANKKIFTVEFQDVLTNKMNVIALNIHILCWTANNILVNSAEDMERRLELQERAAMECNNLLSLMEIAKSIFHLATKRVQYWGGLTIETRNLIRAWRESDRKRYSAKFKNGM